MATGIEIRTTQKALLYDMLKAKMENGSIDDLIKKMKASMEAEDFAYVEKIINEEK
ncbi:MAG: hypothetical protein FWD34_03970 [Oscillospiraceae bacterium]|nr:hypothetical protein [Oscillospiraceae bacterium]